MKLVEAFACLMLAALFGILTFHVARWLGADPVGAGIAAGFMAGRISYRLEKDS